MSERVFIFGAGYSARAFARELAAESVLLGGTTRSTENAETLAGNGIRPFVYTGEGFTEAVLKALRSATHLVVSIAPGEDGDMVLADLQKAGAGAVPALQWICYLSTVGVYGNHDCGWVDEESECRPVSRRSRWRLAAEQTWQAFSQEARVPTAILRLAGIYGPGRNAFVNLTNGTARRIVKPGQVFNRVHVEDVAGAMRHLMRVRAGGLYNVADDEPAPPQDVVAFAAQLMGVEPPPEVAYEDAGLSPMGRSFYGECKRASNRKLETAGYRMRHPDYRQALAAMWENGGWKDDVAANML